ncbi:hypothetical protein U1737_04775 [Sphingomonas sp. LB3N6]|uniref:hypothetical protein n=1 Tax=Sphingomonas fucosidasi TaxID=3096164 RepID=UPI002FC81674
MANAWILPPLAMPSITVSSIAIGAGEYMANDYAGVVWRSAAGDIATVIVDLGADRPLDTLMLFGVDGTAIDAATLEVRLATAAQGANFSGQSVTTGAGAGNFWMAPVQALLSGERLTNGAGVAIANWGAPAPAAARYLLLRIAGMTAGGSVQISRIVAGKRIQLARNFGYGAAFGIRDLGSLDFTRRGVLQRSRGKKLRTVGLTFSNIYKDEVEAITQPLLERIGNTEMVALLTDPGASDHRQSRSYFGPLVGELSHAWRKATVFEAKANMVSIF